MIVTSGSELSIPAKVDFVFCTNLSPAFVPSASVPLSMISSPASVSESSVASMSTASPALLAKVPVVLTLFNTNVATSCGMPFKLTVDTVALSITELAASTVSLPTMSNCVIVLPTKLFMLPSVGEFSVALIICSFSKLPSDTLSISTVG